MNKNFSNNKYSSSKTNNINNIDTDETNDSINDTNVTIRRKKPNKKKILLITIMIIAIKNDDEKATVAIKAIKMILPRHCHHKTQNKLCSYLKTVW